jgi:hypothetical protein
LKEKSHFLKEEKTLLKGENHFLKEERAFSGAFFRVGKLRKQAT